MSTDQPPELELAPSARQMARVSESRLPNRSSIRQSFSNLTVAGVRTYHVGTFEALVHNCAKPTKNNNGRVRPPDFRSGSCENPSTSERAGVRF